jgi:hypothetical protein
MVARLTLLAVAILTLAWLGVLWRDHRIVEREAGELIFNEDLSASEFQRGARRIEDARLLNPDPTWRLQRGLALIRRDRPRAIRELERVVASEPDNVTAWKFIYGAARGFDRPVAARARVEIERLDPLTEF